MDIIKNHSLRKLNTFQIDAKAKFFTTVNSIAELLELQKTNIYEQEEKLVLGGGSNILFAKDFDGLIIKNSLKGVEIIKEDSEHVWLKIGSGENWHDFVLTCLKNKWYGLENLSLIPGTVGAAPVQNIGAYGVEQKEFFESLTAISLSDGKETIFNEKECNFGYRQSVFKNELKNKLFISHVTYKLRKQPIVNVTYNAIKSYLSEKAITEITPDDVSKAVIAVRKSKLPDPDVIGNGGSFFKNPMIKKKLFTDLQNIHPEIPHYIENENEVKIPAGWLIEQCGWKGNHFGNAGVHEKQALVLVNLGNAKGTEIVDLSERIQESVLERFQIRLEPEVNII